MRDGVSLLLPPCGQEGATFADQWIQSLIGVSAISSFWARDVPVAPVDDLDVGSGLDPFVYCSYLLARHPGITALGVAVAPVGSRSAAATARAAASLSDIYNIPFRLGIGAGDKPALTRMNGMDGADRVEKTALFVRTVANYLSGQIDSAGLRLDRSSSDSATPTLWLATSNRDLVAAVADDLYGWLSWLAPLPLIRERIAEIRRVAPKVTVVTTVNVWLDDTAVKPQVVKAPITVMRLPPSALAPVLLAYQQAGVEELILNLPVVQQPEQQLELLMHGMTEMK